MKKILLDRLQKLIVMLEELNRACVDDPSRYRLRAIQDFVNDKLLSPVEHWEEEPSADAALPILPLSADDAAKMREILQSRTGMVPNRLMLGSHVVRKLNVDLYQAVMMAGPDVPIVMAELRAHGPKEAARLARERLPATPAPPAGNPRRKKPKSRSRRSSARTTRT
jgi:hypothetical protein